MSWFTTKKAFTAGTKAKAAELNENFDQIEDTFNSLFQAGRVQAGGKGTLTSSYSDIPGASVTLTVPQASLLLAVATFDVAVPESTFFTGNLNIDGATGPECILAAPISLGGDRIREAVTQVYFKELAAGSKTVKMVGKRNGADVEIFNAANTGFLYLLVPDPEP